MRSRGEVDNAAKLLKQGFTATEVASLTGIPRSTVRDWSHGRMPRCWDSDCVFHDPATLDDVAYAYLLGIYLGDGCISADARRVRLRITLDAKYGGIVEECASAIGALAPGRPPHLLRSRRQRTVEVSKYWKHWLCLIPQHGPGPKHLRRIALEDFSSG
jgi:hypothetical protein